MKPLFLIATALVANFCFGQQYLTPPKEYYSNLSIADSLSELKQYDKAIRHLNLAFESFGWRGTPDDRYKAAKIYALASNYDSAFANIERLVRQQYINYTKISNNSAFANLRQSNPIRFDTLLNKIKLNKEKLAPKQNLVWSNYLDSIFYEDQVIRLNFQKVAMAKGWDSPEANALLPEMKLKDSLNLIAVQKFVGSYGWQSKEVIGQQGNSTLFLVIQHSDSATQEKYLPILRKAVKQKKANPADLALLEDRLSVAKYGYQIYGSQIQQDPQTKKMVFIPIKNELNVDKRRKKMGLQPLTDYAKLFGMEYTLPTK